MILQHLRNFDAAATSALRSLPLGRTARILLSVLAHSGDSLVLIPAFVLIWCLQRFALQGVALPLAVGYLLSVLMTAVIKYSFRRRRPPGEWGRIYRMTDPHSFPSGHASRSAALLLIIWARESPLLGLVLLAWTLAVGFTRIVLGVHYVLDVLAGFLLGLGVGGAVLVLWQVFF